MRQMTTALALFFICASVVLAQESEHSNWNLWAYKQANISNEQQANATIEFMERLAKAGYTGIALKENRFHRWNEATPEHLKSWRRVRDRARELKLAFIAGALPMGYANDILSNAPDLAEGVPVIDAPFVVRDGILIPDDPITLINGSFEHWKNNVPKGWSVDQPGTVAFEDAEIRYQGKPSLRLQDPGKGNARVWQTIAVKPWQYYCISVAFKTEDLSQPNDLRLMAFGSTGEHQGRRLNTPYLYAKKSAEWKRAGYAFNTREYTKITVYAGSWSGGTGKMWFADVTLEPAGLVNLLRRDGAPFKATTADGKIVLVEGSDLPAMRDPGLGKSPYNGGYQWHAKPKIVIPAGSRLKEGERVLLNYSHAMLMCYGDQVPICMAEPQTNELIDRCIAEIEENLHPDGYFLQHDEIRMQGWDESCRRTGKTGGQILAENIQFCTQAIRKRNATSTIYVWSDMFDPYHNAFEKGVFELCAGEGPWFGSWKGLETNVGLINWNANKVDSLKWFSELGHPQIISAPNATVLEHQFTNAKGLKGVDGACYVTWSNDFTHIEAFAKKAHELWGRHEVKTSNPSARR